jgi:hypothetical protein
MAKKRFADALKELVAYASADGLDGADMRRILDEQLGKGKRR